MALADELLNFDKCELDLYLCSGLCFNPPGQLYTGGVLPPVHECSRWEISLAGLKRVKPRINSSVGDVDNKMSEIHYKNVRFMDDLIIIFKPVNKIGDRSSV